MISNILTRIFGSRNERLLKQYAHAVAADQRARARDVERCPTTTLRAKTAEFKERVANGETLDALLPEAFAVVREAGKRALKMRHFDVQLIGGMALHNGKIAEMRTGEGKTLVATLPVYLNALAGKGVHVVTVNDYLAQRDADWMGRIYRFLGPDRRRQPVADGRTTRSRPPTPPTSPTAPTTSSASTTCATTWCSRRRERVQRGLNYAIVDEVDSILIDEARTPLIISGQADDNAELYDRLNELAPQARRGRPRRRAPGDYSVDEKAHQVLLSEEGHENAEGILGAGRAARRRASSLYDAHNITLMHHLYAALRAHALYHRDQHYVVQNGEVVIVDEFTGRLMSGRRWSDGLHQAVEAKEGVPIQSENQTLASITFQNYFRMYGKLAGMTGTADTEAYEFQQIYGLETVVIPTNQPMIRKDENDLVYQTFAGEVRRDHRRHPGLPRARPAGAGRHDLDRELRAAVAAASTKEKLPHQVLNAKQHAREAEIVAQAGRPSVITIATNMAGRGTDIVLGGNVEKQILKLARRRDARRRPRRSAQIDDAARRVAGAPRGGRRRRAACTSSAPSATNRGASTTSCAAAPAARATRARRASTCRSKIRCCASSPASALRRDHGAAQDARGRGDRASDRQPLDREGAAPRRGAQLRHPQAAARVRRRRQRPAQGDLPAAQRDARGDRRRRARSATCRAAQIDDDGARATCRPESVEEQWDIAGLEKALAGRVPDAARRSASG